MSIGYFSDKKQEPSVAEMQMIIGDLLPLWEDLIQSIHEEFAPIGDFKFLYGKNYGWGWRFRTKGRLLAILYPAEGRFVVQIILSQTAIDSVLSMDFGKNVRQAIHKATPYKEGRWLFVPVECKEDLLEVKRLLDIKVKQNKPASFAGSKD